MRQKIRELDKKAAILLSNDNSLVIDAIQSCKDDPKRMSEISARLGGKSRGKKPGVRDLYKEIVGVGKESLKIYLGKDWSEYEIDPVPIVTCLQEMGIDISINEFCSMEALHFGQKFEMRREVIQKAVDVWIESTSRPHKNYFLAKDDADDIFDFYGGVYQLFLPVASENSNALFALCTLRVRYVLAPEGQSGAYIVRSKLHIPVLDSRRPYGRNLSYYSYLGKVVTVNNTKAPHVGDSFLQWSFQEQVDEFGSERRGGGRSPDFLNMTTYCVDKCEEPHYMAGILTSLNQDRPTPRIYSAPVYIVRMPYNNLMELDGVELSTDEAISFMKEMPRTFESLEELADCDAVDESVVSYFVKQIAPHRQKYWNPGVVDERGEGGSRSRIDKEPHLERRNTESQRKLLLHG